MSSKRKNWIKSIVMKQNVYNLQEFLLNTKPTYQQNKYVTFYFQQ